MSKYFELIIFTAAAEDYADIVLNELDKNKVLDISAASKETGANVQIWDKCNGTQQRFYFIYLSDGYYIIKNINSGKVLDVANAGKSAGTNVQQWDNNYTDAQKWKIEKISDYSFLCICIIIIPLLYICTCTFSCICYI